MKGNTKDIIKRQLLIIELLLSGRYISTADIKEHLADNELSTAIRTIQRDMVILEDILPIECRKDDKPYSWRWQPTFTEDGYTNQLGLSQAIALRLVETELRSIIPKDLYQQLQPLFIKAHFLTGLTEMRRLSQPNQAAQPSPQITSDIEQIEPNRVSNLVALSPLQRIIMTLKGRKYAIEDRIINFSNQKKTAKRNNSLAEQTIDLTLTNSHQSTLQELQHELNKEHLDWLAMLLKE